MDNEEIIGDDGLLGIAEVSEKFGLTLRALRYYEQRGLLTPSRSGATRLYGERDIEKINVILKYKRLGFTIKEIKDLAQDHLARGVGKDDFVFDDKTLYEQIGFLEERRRENEEGLAALRAVVARRQARAA